MAEQAIRSVAPRGPYRLLGHSFGGWVATEMARQLDAAGEKVETLVVLDSMPPPTPNNPYRRLSRLEVLERLIEIYELTLQRPLGLRAAELAPLPPNEQLALLLARLIDARVMHRGAGIETMRGIVQVFATNINSYYVPEGPYAGTVHLVKVPEQFRDAAGAGPHGVVELDDHACEWREFATDARYWMAPGNHMTMLSAPHVERLAGWLQPLLGGMR
jgi:thioesterase domain-containing protein